ALSTLKSNIDSGTFRGVMDAAVAALTGDQAWTLERNAQYRRRRDLAVTALRRAGLAVSVPKAAIYVWARLPEGVDDVAWVDGLLEQRHVSLTPGSIFGPAGRGYVRLSLCLADARLEEAAERIGRYDHRQSL
ncbi:MAG TPA: aminotransferase class I/II-fold pyridoxal phosphate-dependent enzyme, partial [Anaerolineales bacterium]|nr:aminotransferase class I/II-fold pyridoxal phosphate-dependent enzyme [Anaerolineales bacterium]